MADMQLPQSEFVDEQAENASSSLVLFYVGILRRRLWIILPILVICGTLGLFKAVRTPDLFRADTQLLVEKQASALDFANSGRDTRWDPNFHTTQQQLIKGRVVMDIALRNERIRDFLTSGDTSGAVSPFLKEFKQTIKALLGIKPGPPDEIWKKLADKISAVHIEDTDIFSITVRCTSAPASARIANEVSRAFQTYHRERHVKNLGTEYEMLKTEKDRAEKELLKSEREMQGFLENATLVSPSASQKDHPAIKALKRLNDELTEVNLERIVLSSEISVMKEVVEATHDLSEEGLEKRLFSIPTVEANRKLGETRKELSEAEKDLAMLRDTYGARHPKLKAAEMTVEVLRGQFSQTLQEISLQQSNRLQQLQQQEQDLKDELEKQNAQALELASEHFDYARLKSSIDRNTRVLDVLNEKMREADVGRGLAQIRVDIIETAEIPSRAENSLKIITVVLFLCFGLFSGCGMAFLFENIDDTIKTPEDLTDRLDVPLLGFVPEMEADAGTASRGADKATGFWEAIRILFKRMHDRFPGAMKSVTELPSVDEVDETPDEDRQHRGTFVVSEPMSSIAEAYRSVRASMLYSMPADEIRMIAVTSCRPQEGKTTTCCNISLSLAQTGRRVLLIDADLHRPMIQRTFNISSDYGLTSALVGEKEWKECLISPTIDDQVIEKLDILVAGPSSPTPSELLGSNKMKTILDEIRGNYDIVIIDTPPVLFASDASVVGVLCDGVILIVKSGDSTRSLLNRAVDRLTVVRARIIGSILNGVIVSRVGRYYSTYYHVGYSRYAKDYGRSYYESDSDEQAIPDLVASDEIEEHPGAQAEPGASDRVKDNGKKKRVAADESREQTMPPGEDVDRLQQDLNAEKVMRERAAARASETEHQLRDRIEELEAKSQEAVSNAESLESDLGETVQRARTEVASDSKQAEAAQGAASQFQAMMAQMEKKVEEAESRSASTEETLKSQLSASEQRLQQSVATQERKETQFQARIGQLESERTSVPEASPAVPQLPTPSDSSLALQQALAYMATGSFEEARGILAELVSKSPEINKAWELYIDLLSLANKQDELNDCARQLHGMDDTKAYLEASAWGHLALIQGDLGISQTYFEKARAMDSENAFVLESITKLDVQQDRIDKAREHAEELIKLDPQNPYAHYVTAFLLILRNQPEEAERALRLSISFRSTAEALHDLAWILCTRDAFEEAEEHARSAVRINDTNPAMWDTLGLILMNRENLADAEQALHRSLSLKADNVATLLNMTEIHARRGNRPKALELNAVLSEMQDKLSPADRDRLGIIRDLVVQG